MKINPFRWRWPHQHQAWRAFALVGAVGAAAIWVGFGWAWGLAWGLVWALAAVLTRVGVINPVVAGLLLVPAATQGQAVELGVGWYWPGRWTEEPVAHVRLDPGNVVRLSLAIPAGDRWEGVLAVTRLDSELYVWTAGEGDASWWDPRPGGDRIQLYPASWTCAMAGARRQLAGPLRAHAAAGGCMLRTSYAIQGAGPTWSPHVELGARLEQRIRDGAAAILECYAHPTLLFGHEFVRHAATRGLDEGGDDSSRQRGNLVVPTGCGLGLRVTP